MGVLAALAGALALPKIARAIEKAPADQCDCACCDAVEVTVGPAESVIPLEFSEEAPRTVLVKIGQAAQKSAYAVYECECYGGEPAIAVLLGDGHVPAGSFLFGRRVGRFAPDGPHRGKPLICVRNCQPVRHIRIAPEESEVLEWIDAPEYGQLTS